MFYLPLFIPPGLGLVLLDIPIFILFRTSRNYPFNIVSISKGIFTNIYFFNVFDLNS